jgi:hypothetical protein
MSSVEYRVANLEKRNSKVELDKKWETSLTRKFSIAILTYFVLGFYMLFLGIEKWYLNAIIPTFGYLLSTLALPLLKKIWERFQNNILGG